MNSVVIANDPDQLLLPYLNERTFRTNVLYLVVTVMVLAGIGLLPVVKVSQTVQGRGIIRPVSEKSEIKSIHTEMVSRIYVKEGQQVLKGDTLVALRSEVLSGRIHFLSRELDRINLYIRDLSGMTSLGEPSPASGLYMQQFTTFKSNLAELDGKIHQAGTEEKRSRYLFDKEIIPAREYESQVFKLRLLEEEKGIMVSDQMATWKATLSEFLSKGEDLQHQLSQALNERQLYALRAPVGGTVEEFRGIYEGSMVYAGETLAVISPDSEMIVEVVLSAKDIGYVREGQKVRIQVDAFNYQQWGFLEGTVIDISDDFILVDNIPAFIVKCGLNKNYLELSNGTRGSLRKGMTVNACFVLANNSLMHLLLKRSDDRLNPSRFTDR